MPTQDVDRGWAWVVFGVAVFNLAFLGAWSVSVGIFQTEFLKHFEGSTAYVSVAGSLCVSFQMLLGPISSVLCSCLSIRLTLMIGAACLSIGMVSASFASSLAHLIFCFGVMAGFGFGTSYTPSAIVVGHYFKEKRVLTSGIALSATGMGIMSGPHLIGWLIDQHGWRFALSIFGFIAAQMVVSYSLVFPLVGNTNQVGQVDCKDREKSEILLSRPENQCINEHMKNCKNEEHKQTEKLLITRTRSNHNPPNYLIKYANEDASLLKKTISYGQFYHGKADDVHACLNTQGTEDKNKEELIRLQEKTNILGDEETRSKNKTSGSQNDTEDQSLGHSFLRLCNFVKERSSALYIYKTTLFWLLGLQFFCELLGYSIQIVHLPSYALEVGVTPLEVPHLFTVYGVSIIVSRLTSGIIFNKAQSHMLVAYIVQMFLMGVIVALMPLFAHGFIELMIYQAILAVTYGASYALVIPIVIDLFEVGNLASVFGGMMFLGGLAYLIGPLFAGVLFDVTSSYSPGFHVGGLVCFLGCLILVPVVFIKRRRDMTTIQDQELTS